MFQSEVRKGKHQKAYEVTIRRAAALDVVDFDEEASRMRAITEAEDEPDTFTPKSPLDGDEARPRVCTMSEAID